MFLEQGAYTIWYHALGIIFTNISLYIHKYQCLLINTLAIPSVAPNSAY